MRSRKLILTSKKIIKRVDKKKHEYSRFKKELRRENEGFEVA